MTSFKNFFNNIYNKNVENIISIDISNLYSPSIKEINSMFKG